MAAVRLARRGGNWNNGTNNGVFYANLNNNRSNSNNGIGFRPALPSNSPFRYGQGCDGWSRGKRSPIPSLGNPFCKKGIARENKALWAARQVARLKRANVALPFSSITTTTKSRRNCVPTTTNGLWDRIVSYDSLYRGFCEARKQKRFQAEVLDFSSRLEENLISIQNRLLWHEWRPGKWRVFTVREPKVRVIHAPPFCDRIVHHALANEIRPLLERKMIFDSYACRRGKGTHAAMARARDMLKGLSFSSSGKVYALHTDVSRFFPSVDHDVLMDILRRTVRDREALWLIECVVRDNGFDGVGMPIGALTSQIFANAYLDPLDHYVKDGLGVKRYVRYMDDTLSLATNKRLLWDIKNEIEDFLESRLRLHLNPKTSVYPASHGVDFCGYRFWTSVTLPRKRNLRRGRKRLAGLMRLFGAGRIAIETIRQSLFSLLGYLRHCNARISESFILKSMEALR